MSAKNTAKFEKVNSGAMGALKRIREAIVGPSRSLGSKTATGLMNLGAGKRPTPRHKRVKAK